MKFSIKSGSPEKQRSDCVIVGVYEPRKLSAPAMALDRASGGYLSEMLAHGDMEGKAGSTLLLHRVPGVVAARVLLVGLGRARTLDEREFRRVAKTVVQALEGRGASDGASFLAEIPVKRRSLAWRVAQLVEASLDCAYRFAHPGCKKAEPYRGVKSMTLNVPERRDVAAGEAALHRGLSLAAGVRLAKDLGNLPGNICTPAYLAEQAAALAQRHGLKLEVLEREDMEKLGMGSLLSVARGSRRPPKLIVLHYEGGTAGDKPVVLVGKGITFDAGGISLKPPADMDEMKFDMCGAASVLGALEATAMMRLPLNLKIVIPACENLPDGDANKPGDIVESLSGQTIEVLNTDAEGRLVLCDAMTYAERFNPALVIDVATLTGACVIALGHHASGVYGNRDTLIRALVRAGEASLDRVWPMPLWDDYQEQLKSNFADMANIGGRPAGSITAACFLSRFAKRFHWAHLDIAGTAYRSGKNKGSTGRPVPLLVAFLSGRAGRD